MSETGNFSQTGQFIDIPSGEVIYTGIRYQDGKDVMMTIDLATGTVISVNVSESNRTYVILVPMN